MKVIIAGSRSITDSLKVLAAVNQFPYDITQVVSGGAAGVDRLGEELAELIEIPVMRFPADWKKHGKSAGILRNEEMGRYADALIAIWDGSSRGTSHMISFMKKLGKPVFVKCYNPSYVEFTPGSQSGDCPSPTN
jgi:hypothetical protein